MPVNSIITSQDNPRAVKYLEGYNSCVFKQASLKFSKVSVNIKTSYFTYKSVYSPKFFGLKALQFFLHIYTLQLIFAIIQFACTLEGNFVTLNYSIEFI